MQGFLGRVWAHKCLRGRRFPFNVAEHVSKTKYRNQTLGGGRLMGLIHQSIILLHRLCDPLCGERARPRASRSRRTSPSSWGWRCQPRSCSTTPPQRAAQGALEEDRVTGGGASGQRGAFLPRPVFFFDAGWQGNRILLPPKSFSDLPIQTTDCPHPLSHAPPTAP